MLSIASLLKTIGESPSPNYEQDRADWYNSTEGELTGYDCPECRNRGRTAFVRDGDLIFRECKCMTIRRSLQRIERSGLAGSIDKCTFDSFQTPEFWQQKMKADAQRFLSEHDGKWFYAGGQVGAGKTHICTAIVGELLRRGKEARYMLWRDEVVRLKAQITDIDGYCDAIGELKTVEVLYIDDLFKTEKDKQPSTADINIAFEIINYRYNNPKLVTILSSEMSANDLLNIDEAVGSRIYQRTKEYCVMIGQDRAKNWRLR